MDIMTTLGHVVETATRLREISKNIEEAEFKNLVADLYNHLADVKLEAADLKERIAALRIENRELKDELANAAAPDPEPPIGMEWGCYRFEDDDGFYCTGCWDSKKRKIRTTRADRVTRACPVCEAQFKEERPHP